jgi:hypothetical protein
VVGADARCGQVQRRAFFLRHLRDGGVDLGLREKASLSAVRDIRSKRSVSSISARRRARTSAMIAATASSTSGASSRFIDRSAANAVSKSASVVFRNTGMLPHPPVRALHSLAVRLTGRDGGGEAANGAP